jgi:nucleoid-associated protein YgaU
MGLFSFIKDAGASLLGMKTSSEKLEEARAEKEGKIREFVAAFDLGIDHFTIEFAGEEDDTVVLKGEAKCQEDKEKLILAVGNLKGIAAVDDQMTVLEEEPAPESVFHTVVGGDSLSKISKKYYGNAMRYNEIFEANKPMLKDVNLIYPGQVLRIPGATA